MKRKGTFVTGLGEDINPKPVSPTYDDLVNENSHLKDQNDDYRAQLLTHSLSRVLTPGEEADIARLRAEKLAMETEQNKIAVWLREWKGEEISAGRHLGMSLAEVCIMYMSRSVVLKGDK